MPICLIFPSQSYGCCPRYGTCIADVLSMSDDKYKSKPSIPPVKNTFFYWLLAFATVGILFSYFDTSRDSQSISYSEFLKMIDEGKLTNVSISESVIFGEIKDQDPKKPKRVLTVPVNDDTLVKRLEEKGINFRAEPKNTFLDNLISWSFPILIFFLLWRYFFRRATAGTGGPAGLFGFAKSKAKVFVERDVSTTFADAAGVDEAKEELQELVNFLKEPEKFKRIGGRAPKGVLLVGPPGTGKTLLARALAGEAKVPFFSINGSEFIELFVGLGAARVRDLFQDARNQAPCIIFIDEIDALGGMRVYASVGTGASDEREQTLHQLLAEMDGFDSSQGVIILAATNRPEVLDPALLRAGRFDRQILVNFPDQIGRVEILKVHAKKIKMEDSVKLDQVAALTPGFSGADLANLVNEAALTAVRRNAEVVSQTDFTMAIERVVAGLEHKKRVMNPEEKKRIAYHELGHATVLLALKLPEKIHKISIVPRGLGSLGYTIQRPLEDRYIIDHDELIRKVAMLLGGRASEKIFFPSVSTGAADDLGKATDICRAMVTKYAMSEKLGLQTFENRRLRFLASDYQSGTSTSLFSENTAQIIDAEIKSILDRAFEMASQAIAENRNFIEMSVKEILRTETLDENQILDLWKRHSYKGLKPIAKTI